LLVLSVGFVHGQAQLATNQLESLSDTEVMLRAIMDSTPPLPAAAVPEPTVKFRGFFSAQHPEDFPPFPGNVFGLDVWVLGDGFYVFDDRKVDYTELTARVEAQPVMAARNSTMNLRVAYKETANTRPYLTNLTGYLEADQTMTMNFDLAGGTNFVPYDIIFATNVFDPPSAWTWLGIGYTSNRYTFTDQPYAVGFYALAQPHQTMTVSWGNDAYGEGDVPIGLSNAVQVAGGFAHSLALLKDGTVTAWGNNVYGQTNVPAGATNAVMIASGLYHNVALLTNGSVLFWGLNSVFGVPIDNVPADLTNAVVVAAGALHTLALRSDGKVAAWGYGNAGETNVPSGLTNATAIAAGFQHSLAVRDD
jgi:hypothetical protein